MVWQRMPSLGQRLPLSCSSCHPPPSLPLTGDGLVHSWLVLWYLLRPLFCEQARQFLRLELFAGKFSLSLFFSPLSGYPTVWLAISCQPPQIVLRAFRPSPYPKQCYSHLPIQPHLLVADASVWATSLLGVAIRQVICWFYLFFLPVTLPSEIPKLPADLLVRGFSGVWKLLLFLDSFPGMGLHP